MIKLKEVVKKYQDYEVDEEKLKEILVKPKPKSVWELSKGDRYYEITHAATIGYCVHAHRWDNIPYEKESRNIGNIFLTEEEAEFEIERRKIETILLKHGRRNFKGHENNFYIFYDYFCKELEIGNNCILGYQGTIYFDTTELCQKAINEVGEENIKKYIFGVTDNE